MITFNITKIAFDSTISFAKNLTTNFSNKMQKNTRFSLLDVIIKFLTFVIFKLYTIIKLSTFAIIKSSTLAINESENVTNSNNEDEINELIVESTIQTRTKLITFIALSKMTKQFLHVIIFKRKRDSTNEKERDEHRDKITRAMFALLAQNLENTINDE